MMNPMMIVYIVKWERELELQRLRDGVRRDGFGTEDVPLPSKRKKLKWIFSRLHRLQARESC